MEEGLSLLLLLLVSLLAQGQPYDSLEDLYSPDYGNEVEDSLMPPSFTSSPLNLAITEGDTVRLPCTVNRLAGFVLLWKREGRTIAIGENMLEKVSARYNLETEENGSSLVIRGVEAGDGGQYTCQVSAFRPTQLQHTVRIRVLPTLETSPASLLTVESGQPASLSCSLLTGRASRLFWRQGGVQVSSDGEFSLASARPRHSGVYQCVAQAEGEEVVREVTLSVNYAPLVEQEETHVRRRDGGREIHISCRVSARPPAVVSWQKDGRPLSSDSRGLVTSSLGDLHTLYLLGGGEQAWGDYTCTATNSRGSRTSTVRVSAYADEARLAASPVTASSNSLGIEWQARSHSPVQVWRVQWRAPSLGGEWSEVNVLGLSVQEEVWGGEATLRGLQPATLYQVKISGRNSQGYSQFSRPVSYTTSPISHSTTTAAVNQPAVMAASSAAIFVGTLLPIWLLLWSIL